MNSSVPPPSPSLLRQRAADWISGDPDPCTRAELSAILERDDEDALRDRLGVSLAFGTAGLRGLVGAGTNRMNRAVVIRTTAGLASHLADTVRDAQARGVVIGFDGRHLSDVFATDAAGVLAAAGFRVHLYPHVAPTPLVAYAVRSLGAAAGIVVTASHNAAAYNGFKVYWEDGAQIVPPTDEGIARAIAVAPRALDIPRLSGEGAREAGLLVDVPEVVEVAYVEGVRSLCRLSGTHPPLRIVYTPLHGVGFAMASRALARAGFASLIAVSEQAVPDADFPTVPSPNPEEPAVLARAIALAEREQADLVLANDPDADRLAVAVPDGSGRFVQLSGNEVGTLLGQYALETDARPGERVVVSTIVSSPMLGEIARALGARYDTTLTGFKWCARRAHALAREVGGHVVFVYEEALGYSVGELVRDKDGIGAAALFAELAGECKLRSSSVLARLDSLYRQYGYYGSLQHNVVRPGFGGLSELAAGVARLRARLPNRIAGRSVIVVSDYWTSERRASGARPAPTGLPRSDVLAFELEGGTRATVRPSGTEPKLKIYVDHREGVHPSETVEAARARAGDVMLAVVNDLVLQLGIPT